MRPSGKDKEDDMTTKDKDNNMIDCLCGSRICRKPRFKRNGSPKRYRKPKRDIKPSTNGSDVQVRKVQSPIQRSVKRKQTSCDQDPIHETVGPAISRGVEVGISTDNEGNDNKRKLCICEEKRYDNDWVGCDNGACKYEWIHFSCAGITHKPTTAKWYCETCSERDNHVD